MDVGVLAPLLTAVAVVITAAIGWRRLNRETPSPNEARLQRNISALEDMLQRYENEADRAVKELERERGKVEQLEHELEEERARAKDLIEEKQRLLDASLRKIAILEHQQQERQETIGVLRRKLAEALNRQQGDGGGAQDVA